MESLQSLQSWAGSSVYPADYSSLWENSSCTVKCIHPAGLGLTVISSVASVVGSLLIIGTFLLWKDLRTIARMILVFLAIADLLTGLGYLFGAGVYIHYYYIHGNGFCMQGSNASSPAEDDTYQEICTVQSFLTTVMPMSSFFWTGCLAVYLFLSIAWQRAKFTKLLMGVFHIVAWGIPLVTCVVLVAKNMFGASHSRASGGWCWIKEDLPKNESKEENKLYIAAELMAGKIWEIGVGLVAILAYVGVKVLVYRRVNRPKKVTNESEYSSLNVERQLQAAYSKLDQKLIWLPIVFFLLRMWGTIRFLISTRCPTPDSRLCCELIYNTFLVLMQSFCDPGQGWSNALLFVIFNQKIRHRLFPCLAPCERRIGEKLDRVLPRRKKPPVKPVSQRTVSPVATDAGGRMGGRDARRGSSDKTPLLNDSLRSNISSSVLYSTAITPSSVDSSLDPGRHVHGAAKPKNPSINSKV